MPESTESANDNKIESVELLIEKIFEAIDTYYERWAAKELKELLESYIQKRIEQELRK